MSAIETVCGTKGLLETLADLRMRQRLQRPGGGRRFFYSYTHLFEFVRGTSPNFTQALRHSSLPTGSGRLPLCNNIGRKSQRDQLSRIGRDRPAALLYLAPLEHLLSKFGQFIVLVGFNDMRIDSVQIRF